MLDIVIQLVPRILVAVSYAALGFHFWNTRWRDRPASPLTTRQSGVERALIGIILTIHAALLYQDIFAEGGMRFSFALAVSLIHWLAALIYWLESFRSRMDGMQPLVLPLAALASILPWVFPQSHELTNARSTGFTLHFTAAMLAYSLFTLAALHAVFMSLTEAALHRRALTRRLASLPPLLTMEALLFRILQVAFGLLTLALASGMLFSEAIFGKPLTFSHKTVFAVISWLIFGVLLAGRHRWGWRGRKALHWTLAGFMTLFLAYVGSRFVVEILLGRT